jgi:hypothetical protein
MTHPSSLSADATQPHHWVAISRAMPVIAREIRLADGQKGTIFSAFALAYALFEVPAEWLENVLGIKSIARLLPQNS